VLLNLNLCLHLQVKPDFDQMDLEKADEKELFKAYISKHGKNYTHDSDEGAKRFTHFNRSRHYVLNRSKEIKYYTLKMNHLSDKSPEEYKALLGLKHPKTGKNKLRKNANKLRQTLGNVTFPQINWTNLFLPARNQDPCGSRWAFSSTAVMEAYYFKNGGTQQYFSPQQLLNCDTGDSGCNGGDFSTTYSYIQANGVVADASNPYINNVTTCNPNLPVVSKSSGYNYCDSGNCTENIVYSMLANGPLNVGIDGGHDFSFYSGGIYMFNTCNDSNHAVVLTGYGTDPATNLQYWTIRNSYGFATWGEQGYMRLLRNDTNNHSCFVTSEAYVPTF